MIKDELEERPGLHFLTPIRRNDTRIRANGMLSYEGTLSGVGGEVLYSKRRIRGGRFLYAFKDISMAASEEAAYVAAAARKGFKPKEYGRKSDLFGLIVMESDQELEPEAAYQCYSDRWLMELVFRHYKGDECLDRTNVQGDFSVIGGEFVNFISTTITCRILRKARQCKILEEMSYRDMMGDLNEAWRMADAPTPPRSDDGHWVHASKAALGILERLGISEPSERQEPKKKKKEPKPEKPKRPRGRPRKDKSLPPAAL